MTELKKIEVKMPQTEKEIQEAQQAYIASWSFMYEEEQFEGFNIRNIRDSYPDGFFTVYYNNQPVGNLTSFRTNYDVNDPLVLKKTWREITNGGINDTHIPDGNSLYGSALGIDPTFRGKGLGQKLVEAAKNHCVEKNIQQFILGCRIPDYHHYRNIPVEEYITLKREDGQYLDRELRFYDRCGITFIRPIPEYMSGEDADPESLNYGVQSVWVNPSYQVK